MLMMIPKKLLLLIALALPLAVVAQQKPSKKAKTASPAPLPAIDPEAKLKEMGIVLPKLNPPTGMFSRAVRTGNLVFLSGHVPAARPDGSRITGRLGQDLSIEQGQEAAKLCGVALLASLKEEIGDLKKVRRIVKVLGMVNSTPDFTEQPQVMNAFSGMMIEIFGERGRHARSAVGMAALPGNVPVEIEMIVEVDE